MRKLHGEQAVMTLPQVVWPPRGAEGHGYDPIFQPDGHPVTLGEMPAKTKNSLSHRARAVSRMIEACFA